MSYKDRLDIIFTVSVGVYCHLRQLFYNFFIKVYVYSHFE